MLLAREVLVLGRARERHALGGLVDAADGLHPRDVARLELELQRAVRQLAELELEVLVDRARVDDVVEPRAVEDPREVAAGDDLDARVREHLGHHRGEAVLGHRLEAVREVAVVVVGARRDAAADGRVELGGVEAPLLARVAAEERLVELATDAREDHLLGVVDAPDLLGARLEEPRHALGVEIEIVEPVDGRAVDRDGDERAVDAREHPVLVRAPLGERAQILDDVLGVGMEDVRPVLVVAQPIRRKRIVGIARDVRSLVDDQDAGAELACKPLGDRAAGQAGADHEKVVHLYLISGRGLCRGPTCLERWVRRLYPENRRCRQLAFPSRRTSNSVPSRRSRRRRPAPALAWRVAAAQPSAVAHRTRRSRDRARGAGRPPGRRSSRRSAGSPWSRPRCTSRPGDALDDAGIAAVRRVLGERRPLVWLYTPMMLALADAFPGCPARLRQDGRAGEVRAGRPAHRAARTRAAAARGRRVHRRALALPHRRGARATARCYPSGVDVVHFARRARHAPHRRPRAVRRAARVRILRRDRRAHRPRADRRARRAYPDGDVAMVGPVVKIDDVLRCRDAQHRVSRQARLRRAAVTPRRRRRRAHAVRAQRAHRRTFRRPRRSSISPRAGRW